MVYYDSPEDESKNLYFTALLSGFSRSCLSKQNLQGVEPEYLGTNKIYRMSDGQVNVNYVVPGQYPALVEIKGDEIFTNPHIRSAEISKDFENGVETQLTLFSPPVFQSARYNLNVILGQTYEYNRIDGFFPLDSVRIKILDASNGYLEEYIDCKTNDKLPFTYEARDGKTLTIQITENDDGDFEYTATITTIVNGSLTRIHGSVPLYTDSEFREGVEEVIQIFSDNPGFSHFNLK